MLALFNPSMLQAAALSVFALGALLAGIALLAAERRRERAGQVVHRALERTFSAPDVADAGNPAGALRAPARGPAAGWLESPLGRKLVADEDRKLIDQCGFASQDAQQWFLMARVALSVLLPLASLAFFGAHGTNAMLAAATLFALGFLGPKWALVARAARRRKTVRRELPLFVDILRLLQGVGLSLDQSLQVMASDFRGVLHVLGREIELANRQYAQGRTREHSLQRFATLHGNDDLVNLVALLVQVDRHGGAVQEPLKQFGERLREWRKFEMKERIGKITVKMTVVMITTLLPALLIVSAGPGFLAVVRSLGALGK